MLQGYQNIVVWLLQPCDSSVDGLTSDRLDEAMPNNNLALQEFTICCEVCMGMRKQEGNYSNEVDKACVVHCDVLIVTP